MQNSIISSWGAQDKFMAHYIVKKDVKNKVLDYTANTILHTRGRFAQKQISAVSWDGGKLAYILNQDTSLNNMIIKQTPYDGILFVEPTNSGVRIYGKWKNLYDFTISKELFLIYDIIAGHIKSL
ncbi:MAG: hypothetical protein R1F52_07745 [Candidatus Nitrosoabyssus spongiisocia]|nr:MAG: hypothetical protein R1F52_07745 [Nitrosopumilaceae archaeon AB1(1)]